MMQNTPPVARGGFLWSVGRLPWVVSCRKAAEAARVFVCELVKARFRREEWTEWAPGVLEALGADVPVEPPALTLEYRAGLLLDLGMDFARVAEVLQVSGDELLRALPRVDGRVVLPSTRAYQEPLRAQRLRGQTW